ncbi:MAG: glycosyltransferase family 39 protein [Elainellaceae cyanobacterium]
MFQSKWVKQLRDQASSLGDRPRLIFGLMVITLVGLGLRFWQLDAKPLWLDEVIGALFSLGRTLDDVPLDQYMPLTALDTLFTVESGKSCAEIAGAVATDSVHPPVYFCLMYRWMSSVPLTTENWVWWLRSLPAMIGVLCIPLVYSLNRLAFSNQAGLASAALMAVSPFAVYLSQEARHYTLPMLITLVALIGLVQIQQAMVGNRRVHWGWLVGWAIANSIGMYVHYFYILDVLAQVGAMILWFGLSGRRLPAAVSGLKRNGGRLLLALVAIATSYVAWLPTLIGHFSRPETDWLKPYKPDWSDRVAPLYQALSGWLLMVIALPIEDQPWSVILPSALIMLTVGGGILWCAVRGWRSLWRAAPAQRPALILLGGFVGCVLLQFFGITYLLDKDVTSVPRYNFVYYPGVVALLGAGLATEIRAKIPPSESMRWRMRSPLALALLAGFLSSLLVVYGVVFQKGYYPDRVAQDLAFEGDRPLILAVSYESLQEVGLGLSFALELQDYYEGLQSSENSPVRLAFLNRSEGFGNVWRSLARLDQDLPLPLNLWVVASPGMKTKDYPDMLRIRRPDQRGRVLCPIDPDGFNRIGFPYQLFRCQPRERA